MTLGYDWSTARGNHCAILVLLALLFFKSVTDATELEQLLPIKTYRIQTDPKQVKPESITMSNLFAWLNLKNSVKFRLWTRKNPHLAHEIKYQNLESLKTSNFDPRRLTKIIIHGFADTATEVAVSYYLFDMRDAYLHLGDVNVFIMDYALFTLPIFYYAAVPDQAAHRLAEFIEFLLHSSSNLKSSSIHLIGFSLGAQVAGLAGHRLQGKLGRITGLDPAGPTFHYLSNDLRLDRSDAKFVDIIHTSSGKNFWSEVHLGIDEALGHVDMYPNGGSFQVGCVKPTILNFSYKNLECSHGRSARYFIESITSPLAFPACQCESFQRFADGYCNCKNRVLQDNIYMGEHLNQSVRGIFQLVTKSKKPFGSGPKMDVTLPNVEIKEPIKLRLNTTNQSEFIIPSSIMQTHATLIFNKTESKVKYKNTYNALDFPNDDIVKLCHTLLKQLHKG